ncbi:MAG: hypothetical protein DME22_13970 [Verrucomicrobia bacterium]|nr:MAG: hypothetical protein DME22_13970 [Verrucomicrobiota bacterium]
MKSRFVILALVLAKMGSTAWGAEDPARFLAVTTWEATFTRTLQSSGTYTDSVKCVYNWSFSHAGVISSQLELLFPLIWDDAGNTNVSVNLSIQDMGHRTCGDFTETYQASDGPSMMVMPGCGLEIDLARISYRLKPGYVVGPISGTVNGDPFPDSFLIWFPPFQLFTNPIVEPLPASGMILQGSRRYSLSQLDLQDAPVFTIAASGSPIAVEQLKELTGELVLTWSLTPQVEELEVVVQPEGYAEWTPEGNLKQPDQRGNTNRLSARLQKKGGGVPTARATRFDFELLNVSAEPGVCMNFPIVSPSTQPDLKFEFDLNQPEDSGGDTVIVTDDVVGVFADQQGVLTAQAMVSSFDFGAYGEIRVTAYVSGRDPIVGYLKGDPQKRANVPLPKCQPGSHIADIWKERWGVSNLADEADDEDFPEGDSAEFGHLGDGYTLYEEYRGFSENRDHRRLIPLRKEVFIRNDITDGRVTGAILAFKAASLLGVYYELRADEISQFGLMNVNHGHAYSGHPQSGILLKLRQQKLGYSQAVTAVGAIHNSTPGSKLFADIEPKGEPGGLEFSGAEATAIFTLASIGAVAHEIAHCCSVWHHGDLDLGKRRWVMEMLPGGSNELHELPEDTDTPATVLTQICKPDGTRAFLPFEFDKKLIYPRWVAAPQGQHSGDTGCMMCYDVANAYKLDASGKRYVADWLPVAQEHLCTSPAGTGVNQPPNSRHGAADDKRGNCKGQICVNDKYMDAGEHKRE